jgi:predicted nucleic acid-binding protein
VFHRHVREKSLTVKQALTLQRDFFKDLDAGVWSLLAVKEATLRRLAAKLSGLDPAVSLRAADAIHLWAASEAGFSEIWSNDRHLLGAAKSFGLAPRRV